MNSLRSGTRSTSQLRRLFFHPFHPQFPAPAASSPARAILASRSYTSSSPYGVLYGVTKPAVNRGFVIVPKGKAAVIERNRRYSKTVEGAGFRILNPFLLERVSYLYRLREEAVSLPPIVGTVGYEGEFATILIDGFINLKIVDPELAFYSSKDDKKPIQDVLSHAQNTVLDELRGMMTFFKPCAKTTLQECRGTLPKKILKAINKRTNEWGVQCVGCEIYNIYPHTDLVDNIYPHTDLVEPELKATRDEKTLPMLATLNALNEAIQGKDDSRIFRAYKRFLTEFPLLVIELVNESEYSQALKEDIDLASESSNQLIEAIAMAQDSRSLEKSISLVFGSIKQLLNAATFVAPESLELEPVRDWISYLIEDFGGLEAAGQCSAEVLHRWLERSDQ